MKIEGFSGGVPRAEVVLSWPGRKEPLILELNGLPIGVDDRIRERIPNAVPPSRGIALDPKTRKPLRDAATGKVLPATDFYDRSYQAAQRKQIARRTVLMVVEALKEQSKLTFDAVAPDEAKGSQKEWEAYADAIEAEFAAEGFTEGHITKLANAMLEVSGMTVEELDEAREAFLSEEPGAESPGESQTTADEA